VEGTTVHGRLSWHAASLVERRQETATASTLVFDVRGWPGHLAGQHVDVRLRAADGYTAVRTYSIANAPDGTRVELTVELMPDGEVSPYLVQTIAYGSSVEILGPIGGWFVWRAEQIEPVQLIAGGSGVVPLMAMIRARRQAGSRAPFRLLYSVRSPDAAYYKDELMQAAAGADALQVTFAYTRGVPANSPLQPKRIDAALIEENVVPSQEKPTAYVCGPTNFVEAVSGLLTKTGYDAARIKTERFGPTGTRH
jgi:ferredoxin-NADP reductase